MRSLRGANSAAVLRAMNPIVRGWSAYYRTVVSSEVFTALDNYLWALTYKWAKHSHPNKPKHWVAARYFGRFNKSRQDRWVFGDRDSGAYLIKFSWTKIVRHQLVNGRASPDDPALVDYWAARRRKGPPPPLANGTLRLLQTQNADARSAVTTFCPPSPCQEAPASGNTGCGPPARRSAPRSPRAVARRMHHAVDSHT